MNWDFICAKLLFCNMKVFATYLYHISQILFIPCHISFSGRKAVVAVEFCSCKEESGSLVQRQLWPV